MENVEIETIRTLAKGTAKDQAKAVDLLRTYQIPKGGQTETVTFGGGLYIRIRGEKRSWLVRRMQEGKLLNYTLADLGRSGINSITEARQRLEEKISNFKESIEEEKEKEESKHNSNSFWLDFSKIYKPGRMVKSKGLKRYVAIKDGTLRDYYKWSRYMICLTNKDRREYFTNMIDEENKGRRYYSKDRTAKLETSYEKQIEEIGQLCDMVGGEIPSTDSEWLELFNAVALEWGTATAQKCISMFRVFSELYDENNKYGTRNIRINDSALVLERKVTSRVSETGSFKAILHPREFLEFVEALKADSSSVSKYILAVVYLPLRRSEWLNLKWSDVDLVEGIVTVRNTKTDVVISHKIPQSLVSMLFALKNESDSELVFSGRVQGSISKGAASVCLKRIGFNDKQTLHGIRASFETICRNNMSLLGITSDDVIGITLHHINQTAYNRANLLQVRGEFLERWATFVDGKLELRNG